MRNRTSGLETEAIYTNMLCELKQLLETNKPFTCLKKVDSEYVKILTIWNIASLSRTLFSPKLLLL